MARKAHKIIVKRFESGNSGKLATLGFIYRHGELQPREVPSDNGAATPILVMRSFLFVKIAGERRFVPEPKLDRGFEVVLCSWDRNPTGLYAPCCHCDGKGYQKVPVRCSIDLATPDSPYDGCARRSPRS